MNLVPQVIECQHGFIEHENSVIDSEIVDSRARNIFDRSDHVVTEVAHGAAGEGRKVGELDGFEAIHRGPQILEKVRRSSVLKALDQERITAQEGISRDSFAAFNAFQKKCVRSLFFKLQESRYGRQKIRNHGLIDRNHIALRLKLLNLFQTWLHAISSGSPSWLPFAVSIRG